MIKHIKTSFLFILYRNDESNKNILWLLAEEKGMYCEGLRNGIAKFNQNRPPQDEPEKALGYKEFYRRINA